MLSCCWVAAGLDNGLGLNPPMGYNTWNDLGCHDVSETNIKAVADAMVSNGLKTAGYEYVNLDDCWHAKERDPSTGRLQPDPKRFPSGMRALGDHLHSKGFKFGIYTDRGSKTCAGFPGSLDHEELDAQTFADWGVDYVKEDNCHSSSGADDKDTLFKQFGLFRDALNKTGRAIFFSVCGGGDQWPWTDISYYATDPRGGRTLANAWRISPDAIGKITMRDAALTDSAPEVVAASGPGGFNDPDMLLGSTDGATRQLSMELSRTQFNTWAILMAPLLMGSPTAKLSNYDLETYTNQEVIAVSQDKLLQQGTVVQKSALGPLPAAWPTLVWGRNLSNGSAALLFVNTGFSRGNITCGAPCWSQLPFQPGAELQVRDLWEHGAAAVPTAVAHKDFAVEVDGFGSSKLFKFAPISPTVGRGGSPTGDSSYSAMLMV